MRIYKTRIRNCVYNCLNIINSIGFDPIKFINSLRGLIRYSKNYFLLKKSIKTYNFNNQKSSISLFGFPLPVLNEFNSSAGNSSGDYFHQDLLIANFIFKNKPIVHLDIGSRVDGFITHLLSFEQKTILGDIRPLEISNPNLSFVFIDLTQKLDSNHSKKYQSISCLHAIEHMGLGRYGDPINAYGHYVAISNLSKLVAEDGNLYLSFPIGKKSRIVYNAHRIISLSECKQIFRVNKLSVKSFSYVDDKGSLVRIINNENIDWENSYNLRVGCGIWHLTKYK